MLKGALLGFGEEAAETYSPALLAAGGRLRTDAVVCAPGEARRARALFPAARLYGSAEELLAAEKGLDFALAAVPAALRGAALAAALKAGLHSAAHPPLAASPAEMSELARLAAARGRCLYALHPWERSLPWSSFSRAAAEGAAGPVAAAELTLLTPRRAGPGAARGVSAALGWQAFAMLLDVVRLKPLAVSARLGTGADYDPEAPEEEAAFTVHFPGATALVRLSAGAFAPRFHAALRGPRGALRLSGGRLSRDLAGAAPDALEFPESLHPGLARPDWLSGELSAFAVAAQSKAPPTAGLKNSVACARLLANAYYSASVRSAAAPL